MLQSRHVQFKTNRRSVMSTELSFEQIIAQAKAENQASNDRVNASLAEWESFKKGVLASLGQDDDDDNDE